MMLPSLVSRRQKFFVQVISPLAEERDIQCTAIAPLMQSVSAGHLAASFNAALVLAKATRHIEAAKLWHDARAVPSNLSIKECRTRAETALKRLREVEGVPDVHSQAPSEKQVLALDVRMFESWALEMEAVEACVMVDE